MTQTVLFSFGCVIFFIVGTGAMLYGMALTKEYFDKQTDKIEEDWWFAIK